MARQRIIRVPHPDTILFLGRLERMAMGDVVSWNELAQLVGKECRPHTPAYSHLYSARKKLAGPPHKMVFHCLNGVGLKRLNDEEIATIKLPYRRKKARRQTRFMIVEGLAADMTKMPPDAARELAAGLDVARRLEHFSRLKFVEELKEQLKLNEPTKPRQIPG